MRTDIAFRSLKFAVARKARSLQRVAQVINAREDNIRIDPTVTSSKFNSKSMRPNCPFSTVLQFMKLGCH